MPTPAEILDSCNQHLGSILTAIVEKQEEYFAVQGRYWQGLRTHEITPSDGISTLPTLDTHPDYQSETWADLNVLDGPMPYALACHQYHGAAGPGYLLIAEIVI